MKRGQFWLKGVRELVVRKMLVVVRRGSWNRQAAGRRGRWNGGVASWVRARWRLVWDFLLLVSVMV